MPPRRPRPNTSLILLFVLSSYALPSYGFSSAQRPAPHASNNSNSDRGSPRYAVPMNTAARQSLPDHLRLEPIPGKGLGVITSIPIPRGTEVGGYEGEVMTAEDYSFSLATRCRPTASLPLSDRPRMRQITAIVIVAVQGMPFR